MPNLKRLDLDKNYLTGLPANLFENNPELQFANFLNNRIRAVPESLFDKNPNLEVVWFSGNMVSFLSPSDWLRSISNQQKDLTD